MHLRLSAASGAGAGGGDRRSACRGRTAGGGLWPALGSARRRSVGAWAAGRAVWDQAVYGPTGGAVDVACQGGRHAEEWRERRATAEDGGRVDGRLVPDGGEVRSANPVSVTHIHRRRARRGSFSGIPTVRPAPAPSA